MKLLTKSNPKILKGHAYGFYPFILHLAPARLSGYQVCPKATTGCKSACLNTAGRGGLFPGKVTKHLSGSDVVWMIGNKLLTNKIQTARIRKTRMFFENRDLFMKWMVQDIREGIRLAQKAGLTPCFRLNGTSDIRWESIPIHCIVDEHGVATVYSANNIMEAFPNVQFYDYTKLSNRKNLPSNYHLTFSLSEDNRDEALEALRNKMNVAVVFRSIPFHWLGIPVEIGDTHDLRFLDPSPCIVGRKARGKEKHDTTGFVR
jgi:hypothetical protein